ncbi:MAG: hypothetical protein RLZZ186_851 [Cyanobacteriota bacterium]|jgi:hypothetical protein
MQYYPIVGEWERQSERGRWLEWSTQGNADQGDPITGWFRINGRRLSMFSSSDDGTPAEKFAAGRITKMQTFRATEDGLWGTAPGADAVVDVWGQGINKLATLAVINQTTYDNLFS